MHATQMIAVAMASAALGMSAASFAYTLILARFRAATAAEIRALAREIDRTRLGLMEITDRFEDLAYHVGDLLSPADADGCV